MNAPRHPSQQAGITLPEACCTLAIVAVLAASALPSLRDTLATQRLVASASRLAADLRYARTEALARNQALRLSLHFGQGGSCYVVHTGQAGQCHCSGPGAATCDSGARSLRTVWLPADEQVLLQSNVASFLFDPVHGTVSPTATLSLGGPRGREIRQVVNIVGRVRSCASGGVVGFGAC